MPKKTKKKCKEDLKGVNMNTAIAKPTDTSSMTVDGKTRTILKHKIINFPNSSGNPYELAYSELTDDELKELQSLMDDED